MEKLNNFELNSLHGGAKPPQQEIDSAKAALLAGETELFICAKPPQQEID